MSQFERICKGDPHVRGLISIIYRQLNEIHNEIIPTYTTKWSHYMDRTFNNDEWSSI